MTQLHLKHILPALFISLFLTSCAYQDESQVQVPMSGTAKTQRAGQAMNSLSAGRPLALIADDLVSVLSLFKQVRESGFVVRMPDARTPFDLAVERSLIKYGFIIKSESYKAGGSLLRVTVDGRIGSRVYTHVIAYDQFVLASSSAIDEVRVAPVTSLR